MEKEVADKKLSLARTEISNSAENIGIRSEFNFGEESKVDLFYIYKKLMEDSIREFSQETLDEFVRKDEVVAFMSKIHDQYLKHDPDEISG